VSERTAPALEKIDVLLPLLHALPESAGKSRLVEEAEALRRAVAAFHMEAIRFRIYNVDRAVRAIGASDEMTRAIEDVRHALEAAGFHTRSHAAPGS
jgi:hypothetical protein